MTEKKDELGEMPTQWTNDWSIWYEGNSSDKENEEAALKIEKILEEDKERFNPRLGRDCYSCAYKENQPGTAHKSCKRNFPVTQYLPATIKNGKTGRRELVGVYVDTEGSLLSIKEGGKEIICTLYINQWSRMFPFDFDPRWVVECSGWSGVLDERYITDRSPMERMVGILGSVGRI